MPCVGKLLTTREDERFQASVDDFVNSGVQVDLDDETEADERVTACDVLQKSAVDFVTEEKIVHKSH